MPAEKAGVGHPRVLGIPIRKTLVIWASPVTLTLALTQIAKVIWEEDAHITVTPGKEAKYWT